MVPGHNHVRNVSKAVNNDKSKMTTHFRIERLRIKVFVGEKFQATPKNSPNKVCKVWKSDQNSTCHCFYPVHAQQAFDCDLVVCLAEAACYPCAVEAFRPFEAGKKLEVVGIRLVAAADKIRYYSEENSLVVVQDAEDLLAKAELHFSDRTAAEEGQLAALQVVEEDNFVVAAVAVAHTLVVVGNLAAGILVVVVVAVGILVGLENLVEVGKSERLAGAGFARHLVVVVGIVSLPVYVEEDLFVVVVAVVDTAAAVGKLPCVVDIGPGSFDKLVLYLDLDSTSAGCLHQTRSLPVLGIE